MKNLQKVSRNTRMVPSMLGKHSEFRIHRAGQMGALASDPMPAPR